MTIADDDAIVSLEAWRLSKVPRHERCQHERSVLDGSTGTVECRDCGAPLSAFHVLMQIAMHENQWHARLTAMRKEVAELKAWQPFLKAVKSLERMWRGKRMLPCCPHCSAGLWPQELLGSSKGVRYELEQRKKHGRPIPAGVEIDSWLVVVAPTSPPLAAP